ncbi:30S ribosomal protein S9 [Candidatus Wolfebacteria bacterium]|nr:30S ribosomal protein S9 [Candidatus Wolfebacteria bacterium]
MAETRYIEAIGRRKSAAARVRITPADKISIIVNDKPVDEYFSSREYVAIAEEAFKPEEVTEDFSVTVKVKGGGQRAQADAVRHGIARALVKNKEELRGPLKSGGLLTRDPRVKERKKPGLKKARKAAQWSKR